MQYADIVSVLGDVQGNNSREWYVQQKEIFKEIHILLHDLYFAVGSRLREKVHIDNNPRKSISRPYNDQRFGHKPYLRDNMWITFQTKECPMPAFFIEFSSCGIRIGMGYYSAAPAQMRDLRGKIDHRPQRVSGMLEKVLQDKELQAIGEPYKKRFPSSHEGLLGEIYNFRSIYFQKIVPANDWENIEQIAGDTFLELVPMYQWFVEEGL